MRVAKEVIRLAEAFADFSALFFAVIAAYCIYVEFVGNSLPEGLSATVGLVCSLEFLEH